MPIQQMLLGVGGSIKTYVDDIFNTYLRFGTAANDAVNNGIDFAGKGGLVWSKRRDNSSGHAFIDTARGTTKVLQSNNSNAEGTYTSSSPAANSQMMQSFNSNGYTIGPDAWEGMTNIDDAEYAHFAFRKAKGFFDVVTYNGDSGAPNWGTSDISHNLGCIPGLIILKKTNGSGGWWVYHRDLPATTNAAWSQVLRLDDNGAKQVAYNLGTASYHTATTFRVGNDNQSNNTGDSYVAYLFAGGESTASTAVSVDLDGNDYLSIASSSDLTFGTGDFTIEFWAKPDDFGDRGTFYDSRPSDGSTGITIGHESSSGEIRVYMIATSGSDIVVQSSDFEIGQWQHIAVTRASGTVRLFINGTLKDSGTRTSDLNNTNAVNIGYKTYTSSSYDYFDGKISNVRVVKGTAVYTSSFRPPTEPLTNITNTKLLCFNNSSTTGSTVTPGTITANGDPTASTDSPFDDPAGFVFGAAGDQEVIKCGSYVGTGQSTSGTGTAGPNINVGWEPQLILVKCSSDAEHWELYDSLRGIVTGGTEPCLEPNLSNAESQNDRFSLTPTGFQIETGSGSVNGNGDTYIYMCIRRPDSSVGKPPELGTGVFAMDTGAGTTTIPNYDSNFPVDFILEKKFNDTSDWWASGRLIQGKYVRPNSTGGQETASGTYNFDSNVGWGTGDWQNSNYQSWMWKRHAGFDVVTYKGTGSATRHRHNLNQTPGMFWIKRRDTTSSWLVWHEGLSSTTQGYLVLNTNAGETNGAAVWNNTAPNSSTFSIGTTNGTNNSSGNYLCLLFSSVAGISKVGYYSGSNSSQTISTGFAPRFLVMKKIDTAQGWVVLDTVRGWGSGDDERLEFHNNSAQNDSIDFGAPTSSGFTLTGNVEKSNQSGGSYIYYAHA